MKISIEPTISGKWIAGDAGDEGAPLMEVTFHGGLASLSDEEKARAVAAAIVEVTEPVEGVARG